MARPLIPAFLEELVPHLDPPEFCVEKFVRPTLWTSFFVYFGCFLPGPLRTSDRIQAFTSTADESTPVGFTDSRPRRESSVHKP